MDMKALISTTAIDECWLEKFAALREEMLEIDPTGVLEMTIRLVRDHATPRLREFFAACVGYVMEHGDLNEVEVGRVFGLSDSAGTVYTSRLRALIKNLLDDSKAA
jgi:hypothetical protein